MPDINDLNKDIEQLTILSTIVSQIINLIKKEIRSLSSTHNLTNDIFKTFSEIGQIMQITNYLRNEFCTISTVTSKSKINPFGKVRDKNRNRYIRLPSNQNQI